MSQNTEEKILKAALKVFARKGYGAATTKSIAEESGLSEFTLFRKFKTKENLFNTVLEGNMEKMQKDLNSILIEKDFKTTGEFLETFIRNLSHFYDDNIESFSIFLNEDSDMLEPMMKEYIANLTRYLIKHIKNEKIDPVTIVLTITAFIYVLNTEKYHGRTFINYDEALENFINTFVQLID